MRTQFQYSKTFTPKVLKAIRVGLIVGSVTVMCMNIVPYEIFVGMMASQSLSQLGLVQFLMTLPGVSFALNILAALARLFVAACIFAVLQGLEILPTMIKRNRKTLKKLIQKGESADQLEIKEDDLPELAKLKNLYNKVPYFIFRRAREFKLYAYTVDFLIGITIFPPVDGGIQAFLNILQTGAWQLLNGWNIAFILLTLFAVEIVLEIWMYLDEIHKLGQSED